MAIVGDRAYLSVGPRLVVVDMTDALQPVLLGQSPVLPVREISDVQVTGSLAFVADVSRQLFILDISNPGRPTPIGLYQGDGRSPTTFDIWSLIVGGDHVYIAAREQGLLVIDIADPTRPRKVGAFPLSRPNEAWDIFLSRDRLYMAAGLMGLLILDVSDATNPTLVGRWPMTGLTTHVVVDDGIAYVKYNFSPEVQGVEDADKAGLYAVDVSGADSLTPVGFLFWPGTVRDMTMRDSVLYMADRAGLHWIDVSDNTNPSHVQSYTMQGSHQLSLTDARGYILVNSSRMHILAMSEPLSPTLLNTYQPPAATPLGSVDIVEDTAYLGSAYGPFLAADISWPNQVRIFERNEQFPIREEIRANQYTLKALVVDDTIYAARGGDGLFVYDRQSPPTFLRQIDSPGPDSARGLAVKDSFLLVAEQDAGLIVYDIGNRQQPAWVTSWTEVVAQDVAVRDQYAYLATGDGLVVANVSDPTQPNVVFTKQLGHPLSVTLVDTTLLLADSQTGLHIFDVTNPDAPRETGRIDTGGVFEGAIRAILVDGIIYALNGLDKLLVIDVRETAVPRLIGHYDGIRQINNLTSADGFLYLATDNGLYVLQIMIE
jgi:hypothetical protein